MVEPYPLVFHPTFKSRIWGGNQLRSWFPNCPTDTPIGEAWVLSDHREGPSPIANGPYEGLTLHELMQTEPAWFESAKAHTTPDGRFPLLIKVIDAADDLSVQVHPDDEYGYRHAGEQGKTECWWVLGAAPASKIVYGHSAKTKSEFESMIESKSWDALLNSVTPQTGDFYFVPSGKLHALGKGTMVLEVQQSSDTTYRVFDYNRLDANGVGRELHLKDAIAVTHCPDVAVPSERASVNRPWPAERLVRCPYFDVEHWKLSANHHFMPSALTVLSVIQGHGMVGSSGQTVPVQPGTQILLPDSVGEVNLPGGLELLAVTLPTTTG